MPLINLEYNRAQVSDPDAELLANAVREIVSEATAIEDVFVYADSAKIQIKTAPIEIFIRMSSSIITDADSLTDQIKTKLKDWKTKNGFSHPINLTLIPMTWNIAIDI